MEKKSFVVFIRLEDGSAKKVRRTGYTIDEVEDRLLNEGKKVARWETNQYYDNLYFESLKNKIISTK